MTRNAATTAIEIAIKDFVVRAGLPRLIFFDKKDCDGYVQKRDMIAAKMTPAQIAEAQRLARYAWQPIISTTHRNAFNA